MRTTEKKAIRTRSARIGLALVLLTGCIAVCCVLFFLWGLADEGTPPTPVSATVSVDFATLPQRPEVEDWYGLARYALDAVDEEQSFLLSGLFGRVACDDPSRIEKVVFDFRAVQFQGVVPHRLYAYVLIDPNAEVAEVNIEDLGPGWRNYHDFDLSSSKDVDEVISIAENRGGRALRATLQEECIVNFMLNEDGWIIDYRDIENTHPELLIVFIDAVTGTVKRVER